MRADAKDNLVKYIVEPNLAARKDTVKIMLQDAINDYLEVTKLNSNYADTAYWKIVIIRQKIWKGMKDSLEKNICYLGKTIELNPKYGDAYLMRGNIKSNKGDKEGACSDWSKASELGNVNAKLRISKYCK